MKKLTKQEEAQFLLKTGHRVYPRHPCAPIVRESPSCVYCEETVQPDISQLYHPSTGWLCIRCEKTLKENPEMKDQNTDENVKWPLPGAKTFSITEKEEKGHYTPCEFCEGKGKITPTHKNENLSPMDCPKCRGTGRMWVKQERIRRDIRKAYIFGRIEVASYIKEDAMDMIVCVPSLPRQLANSEWNPINWAFMGKQSFRNDYWSVSREDFAQNYFPTLELAEAEIKRRETGENKSEKAEEKDPPACGRCGKTGGGNCGKCEAGVEEPIKKKPERKPMLNSTAKRGEQCFQCHHTFSEGDRCYSDLHDGKLYDKKLYCNLCAPRKLESLPRINDVAEEGEICSECQGEFSWGDKLYRVEPDYEKALCTRCAPQVTLDPAAICESCNKTGGGNCAVCESAVSNCLSCALSLNELVCTACVRKRDPELSGFRTQAEKRKPQGMPILNCRACEDQCSQCQYVLDDADPCYKDPETGKILCPACAPKKPLGKLRVNRVAGGGETCPGCQHRFRATEAYCRIGDEDFCETCIEAHNETVGQESGCAECTEQDNEQICRICPKTRDKDLPPPSSYSSKWAKHKVTKATGCSKCPRVVRKGINLHYHPDIYPLGICHTCFEKLARRKQV